MRCSFLIRLTTVTALILAVTASAAMAAKPGAPSTAPTAPPEGAKGPARSDDGRVIPGEYIVVVKKGHGPKKLAQQEGAEPEYVYRSALNGFSADLTRKEVSDLKRNPNVKSVEPARRVALDSVQYMNSAGHPWGLDRMDQRYLPLSRSFTYFGTGANVRAYVIDSGIRTSHAEFGGRAANVKDFTGGNGEDCRGHGTHVAGTIGGSTVGMAKKVMLRGVRVFGCTGGTDTPTITKAVDWVRQNGIRPAVVNMSLGGPTDSALRTAVNNLAKAGFFVSVAAGNEGQPACNVSPADAAGVLTVAASDASDARAVGNGWSSNYGACVDVYAPGVNVLSAWSNGGYFYDSGTSMASPHVAGMVAAAKSWYGDGYTSQAWIDWVKNNATTNVIRNNVAGTANKMAFKGVGF
jgi:subtilisin family serine protease